MKNYKKVFLFCLIFVFFLLGSCDSTSNNNDVSLDSSVDEVVDFSGISFKTLFINSTS